MMIAATTAKSLLSWTEPAYGHLRFLMRRIRAGVRLTGRSCQLDPATLKDIGLSVSDLPAIRAGLFAADASRRPR